MGANSREQTSAQEVHVPTQRHGDISSGDLLRETTNIHCSITVRQRPQLGVKATKH